MFSRLSGIANTVLHELSGDGEGSDSTRHPDPGPESGPAEGMSEDQIERLAHYEQLVVQLKDLIQQKDVEIQHKDVELQKKESQIKSEREASDAKFTKLKLQAKAKVTTLNKQIEELKKTAIDQGSQDESEEKRSSGQNKSSNSIQDKEEANLKLQDDLNELTRQLHESESNISALTKQLSESQETIAGLTKQLQDSQESGLELTKSLQESVQELERTLEEKTEALHSRNQVVEMLEQELQSAELQKRVLSEQFREMEQELISVRESLVIEQKESSQQANLYKDVLEEKSVLCKQLQKALDKAKESSCEMENLKLQLQKGKEQLDATPQPGLGQIHVEDRGTKEELEILRAELEKEKGDQETLQRLSEELQKERDAQEELQHLKEEFEKEKNAHEELQQLVKEFGKEKSAQEELQQLREELEKKGAQEELQQLREELEKKKGTQEELQQLREELEKEKGAQEELQQLREELEKKKGTQEELQQLREELEKEKGAQEELQQLREELEKKGAQEELQQLREELEKKGAQEELQQLREELEKKKGTQEELQQLREELEKEKGAQEELQQLREELEKEKGAQEELQQLREELEKQTGAQVELQQLRGEKEMEKGVQEELQQLRGELEKEKGAREELQQLIKELEKEKGALEELQQLSQELEKETGNQEELRKLKEKFEKEKGAQEDLQQLREELEKEKVAQKELQQLRDELEKEKGAQEDLQKLKEHLEKMKVDQEELKQVKSELEQQKETQNACQVELEMLTKTNELLVKTKGEQGEDNRNESDEVLIEMEKVQIELEMENKKQDELNRLKENLKTVKESLKEFDNVKEEFERGQKMLSELEMLKQEMHIMREAQDELIKLQAEQRHVKKHIEQSSVGYTSLTGQGLAQEEPGMPEKEETSVSFANLSTKHYTFTTGEDSIILSSTEGCKESEVSNQKVQSTVLNVQTSSVSQELVLNVTSEELKEKQLSILMMDLLDTQEEINRLKGELPVEGNLNECALSEQVIEKSQNVSEEADSRIQTHDPSDLAYQNVTVDNDNEILLMKKMVEELQRQIETVTSEKEQISLTLETLLNKENTVEVLSTYEILETEKQQLTDYESQRILVEQVKSLENESKSKDLKIIALQKDLDHMNLLLSERNELSKLQISQLEKKEQHIESLNEILGLSQNKEERLSEELASNEREKVLLQELLSQKTTEIQGLQESMSEKDRQIEEISHSLSDKVVVLNEEKYSMSKEIKSLKEQLNATIQDQNGIGEELIQTLRAENTEIHLQVEKVTKEKCHLQEMFESVQSEVAELKCHLETAQLNLAQNEEMIKIAQEEREELRMQLQDQKCALSKKEKECEELQIQIDHQRYNHVQELQVLTEEQQNSLEVINGLQGEKCILASQLQSYKNNSEHDTREVGLKESEEHQTQLEGYKKEIEQLKRKLQAALTSRKELNRKISKLEKQMVNSAVNQDKDFTGSGNVDVKSFEEVSAQSITDDCLKKQLSERESDLQTAQKELAEKSAANEQYQNLIEELTLELNAKARQIDSLKTEKTSAESLITDTVNAVDQDARIQLENRIATLEEDKEILQKKVQEALNSRRDTIKKAQEKDRHHREQLKQQKEDFNLLQEKYENLQLNQKSYRMNEVSLEESSTQTMRPEKSQNTNTNIFEDAISVDVSGENAEGSHWESDWVDFSPASIVDPVAHKPAILDVTGNDYQMQMEVFQSQKNELECKALQLEEKINVNLEEISHMQNTIEQLNGELQAVKEKNLNLEGHVSTLKAEMECSNQETSRLNELNIGSLKAELMQKVEHIGQLHKELEVVNGALKSANILLAEKDDAILSLQTEIEVTAKEHEELHRKLEVHSLESQNKLDEEVEEAKGKQQLQRKLQAALISRKEALKENKSLKLELYTVSNLKDYLSERLQHSEDLVNQLTVEKDTLLKTLSTQKEERNKFISEIDKYLMENQNLQASCESFKLVLSGITQEKEDLGRELESLKLSQISEISEWQERLTDLQKEYETLLQSYENVSNEMDRMKRAMETVRQEKQELFSKIKSVETKNKEVEKQLEEAEQETENIKEKMRKFAKSKQQKILELEEENDRLRGELQPIVGEQQNTSTESSILKEELDRLHSENHSLLLQLEQVTSEKDNVVQETESLRLQLHAVESNVQMSLQEHTSEIHEEVIIKNEVEVTFSQIMGNEQPPDVEVAAKHKITQTQETLEENSQMKELIQKLECNANIKQNEMERLNGEIKVLMEENLNLETQLKDAQSRVAKMEIEIVQLEKKHQIAVFDLDGVSRQKRAIELEKDELEERLMNQMAELNGSIGNFQQDAMDLEVKNDSLQKEIENLKLQLEEETRQLERQKIDALSEAQKEYVEKLKSANQSAKGRRTQSKELQELLKEKQQEVRHLQKDCIQYQETISGLERAIKALEFEYNKCEKEKLISNNKIIKAMEEANKARDDLTSFRVLLDDTQSEAARVLAENLKLKDEMRTIAENTTVLLKMKEEDMEKRLHTERDKHVKQVSNLQEKINVLQQEKEHLEGAIVNLQGQIREKHQEMKDLQGELNQNIAKLAAFTRSMCSLQNDRDRVIAESKKWSEKLTDAMHKKDIEINDKEKVCVDLKNELLHITTQVEELKAEVTRIHTENKELVTNQQTEAEVHLKTRFSLLEEKAILSSSLEEEQKMHSACLQELKLRTQEANDRQNQLDALEIKISSNEANDSVEELQKMQTEVQHLHTQLSETLTQVHHKELRIQQLNSKLSQIFEEKNALSLQLRGSNQHLRDANGRCSSLERQLQKLQQKNLEALPGDSAPGAPQEKKEPQTETDQQLLELHERYLEVKQQNTEQEYVRSVLEQQLREERQRSECRIQELEENLNMLRSQDWSAPQDPAPHEMSLLIETHGTTSVKTRSSSLRRFLRFLVCSRNKAPLLFSIYLLLIHALLFLCFTGHL
ncbi:golgin subfamily B member 1 isoform X3 [Dendrobates tinctorius]|uniref:golgin subfamily B member 1 isoform X3 n=1 Tax=Dendrobates tinctorius TaxID=92724 RepID=UPI003CCA62D8